MLPYWVFLSLFVVGAINDVRRRTVHVSRMTWALFLAMIVLIVFVGLRYRVGADWLNYTAMFYAVSHASFSNAISYGDPAYMTLNWLAASFGADIWLVNLACACLFGWGLGAFAMRQPNPWLAVAVAIPYFVIVVGMGYTRQATAIAVMLLAMVEFARPRYVRFVLFMTLAVLFHRSAMLMIPFVVLSAVRHRSIILITGAAMLFAGSLLFLDRLLDAVRYNYLDAQLASGGTGIRLAMTVLPALVFLIYPRRLSTSAQDQAVWRNFSFGALGCLALYFFTPSTTLVDRVALYLIPLQVVVLARLPFAFPRHNRSNEQLLIAVIAIAMAVQVVWLTFAEHSDDWDPYRFYPLATAGASTAG